MNGESNREPKVFIKGTCYCCNKHKSSWHSVAYGVPICIACHMGLVLVTWDIPDNKEFIDKYRDKMFERSVRLKAAYKKLGHEWNDPREDLETSDPVFKDSPELAEIIYKNETKSNS